MKYPFWLSISLKAIKSVLLLNGLSVLLISPVCAQLNNTELRDFTTKQGLSNNHVAKVVQDQRGFIWLATAEGLDRYDGTVFTSFYHNNKDSFSIPSNTIGDMELLPGNRLILATLNGLCIFNTVSLRGRTFREKRQPDYYSFNNDFMFVRYDHHHIWAGSRTTLYLFDDSLHLIKKWINPLLKANPYSYAELPFTYPDGKPGFFLNRICYKYNPQKNDVEKDLFLTRILNDHKDIDYIAGNRYGIWWLYSNKDSLFHLSNNNRLYRYSIPIPQENGLRPTFLSTQHDSILWCGDNRGYLVRFNMQQEHFLPGYFHFKNAPVIGTWVFSTSILWDHSKDLWISTVNGLHEYGSEQQMQIFDTSFYFKKAEVKTADLNTFIRQEEGYWVGNYGSGLFWIDPVKHISKHFHFHFNYKETGRNWIWHIFPLTKDTLWLGTQDGLLWFNTKDYHYGMIKGHHLPKFIDTFTVMTLFKDSHDFLWMGMSNGRGLIKYNLRTKQAFVYKKSMLPIPDVSCITEDENGDLWMAFMFGGGLAHWHRKTGYFSVIHAHPNSVFKDDKIYTIYADKQGSVWFNAGTDGLGQYDIKTGKIRIYGIKQGLCSQLINSIAGDSNYLWIGTSNGLSRFNTHTKQFKNYSITDGFPDNYFIYIQCKDSLIYACGAMNMTIFKSNSLNHNPYPPKVYLTNMYIRNKSIPLSSKKKLNLRYNQNYIRFDFTGINYINGKENHYAYKLDGTGSGWVQAGTNRYAVFASLSPGTYAFHIKAANSAGIWSEKEAIYTFTIVPPFWKTIWFIIAVFLVACIVIYLFYRYRLKQVLKMQRIRDRIAADLHDDMGASLSNINILSTMALQKPKQDRSVIRKTLENIRDDAQQTSEAIDDIVWAVNPKNDSLDRILSRMRYYASELFEAKNIQYEINFPAEVNHIRLPMEKRRDLFLIFKEAVNNIAKHSGCTKTILTLEIEGSHIRMQIVDNGKGFDTENTYEGNGLKNMQQRATAMHGMLRMTSEKGKGSSLELVI